MRNNELYEHEATDLRPRCVSNDDEVRQARPLPYPHEFNLAGASDAGPNHAPLAQDGTDRQTAADRLEADPTTAATPLGTEIRRDSTPFL